MSISFPSEIAEKHRNYKEQIAALDCDLEETPKLIAFSGLAGSGKSTAAKYLVKKHGFIRVRFANTMKKMVAAMLEDAGHSAREILEAVDGDKKEIPFFALGGRTPRYVLQTLGTEWGRKLLGETIWVNITKSKIERILSEGGKVVVDDVRFQNEADIIGELGGETYRIIRTLTASVSEESHQSEMQWLDEDNAIVNDGDINDLEEQLEDII